ncbi:C4BPA protein, partial [Grantiella picta]|nr:C4BPA protein [Grantiella picta]
AIGMGQRLHGPAIIALLPAGMCSQPPRFAFAEPVDPPQQSYPEGAVVSYKCRPGYVRDGADSPEVTCLANSSWSEKSAFCIGKSCGQPEIEDGNFHTTTDLRFGATVTFSCHTGYRLIGSPSAECTLRNGEVSWTSVPSCEIILCPRPPAIENGQLLSENEVFTFGMAASYRCDKGLSLIGEATVICTMGPDFQGVWSSPAPECKEVKCKTPQVPNGKRLSGFGTEHTYGDKVTFECNPGYSMKGSSVITCDANSSWTPPPPACAQIRCGRPPQFPFATPTTAVDDTSEFGTEVRYRCSPGYKEAPGTSSVITCQSDETWSAADPEFCVPARCPSPHVQHGRLSSRRYLYSTGNIVTFTCNPGYTLQGSRSSTCGADSRWKPPLPECKKEVTCPRPPNIANGLHNGQSLHKVSRGVTVSYSCREGYKLLGNVSITCTDSGVWSRPLPRCEG